MIKTLVSTRLDATFQFNQATFVNRNVIQRENAQVCTYAICLINGIVDFIVILILKNFSRFFPMCLWNQNKIKWARRKFDGQT